MKYSEENMCKLLFPQIIKADYKKREVLDMTDGKYSQSKWPGYQSKIYIADYLRGLEKSYTIFHEYIHHIIFILFGWFWLIDILINFLWELLSVIIWRIIRDFIIIIREYRYYSKTYINNLLHYVFKRKIYIVYARKNDEQNLYDYAEYFDKRLAEQLYNHWIKSPYLKVYISEKMIARRLK